MSDLHNWYGSLYSRRVDLVGDYAGAELFLIDGDSLLLEVFSDPLLDFGASGFQHLHAAYNVEIFLRRLTVRKCKFHIVFHDENDALCIPPDHEEETAERDDAAKYLLAREAIIRHLRKNNRDPDVAVHVFKGMEDPAFSEYLQSSGIYFVMSHDGSETSEQTRACYQWGIHRYMQRGYNVALLNGLECHDTKLMAMVLEDKPRNKVLQQPELVQHDLTYDETEDTDSLSTQLESLQISENHWASEREALTILSLRRLLDHGDIDSAKATTFLLHTILLAELPLSQRHIQTPHSLEDDDLTAFAEVAWKILKNEAVVKWLDQKDLTCDLADLVDGRLFGLLLGGNTDRLAISEMQRQAILEHFSRLKLSLPVKETDSALFREPPSVNGQPDDSDLNEPSSGLQVLPFEHNVFDTHLAPIHLSIDPSTEQASGTSARLFSEATHWHNQKPLVAKGHRIQKVGFFADRRNKRFMAEMITYAASLTNAAGKVLDPEVIVVKDFDKKAAQRPEKSHAQPKQAGAKGKPGGGGKQGNKKGGREAAMAAAAELQSSKGLQEEAKAFAAWDAACKAIQKTSEATERYVKADKYLNGLTSKAETIVGTEIMLFKMLCLTEVCVDKATQDDGTIQGLVALIWRLAMALSALDTTSTVASATTDLLSNFELPGLAFKATPSTRKLPFKMPKSKASAKSEKPPAETLEDESREFQLEYCGPYFDRSFNPKPDPRVPFQPDEWQRKVLDAIDRDKSLLVIAPTSAGKTFISFYAMKKVLERSDDGVLVYVAPTKALVNQIAAEVQARFSKNMKRDAKSVWGIHTRDYRINNPTGCQVLVTVPHILQIMLLAPSHAQANSSWSNRISQIIFDEVHCIGQADDGLIWEQLLLLAPCPIIALSATVGNPAALSSWLKSTQEAIGNDFVTVQHKARYSDLRKFIYNPPAKFTFALLKEKSNIPIPGLDGSSAFKFVHPVCSLIDRSRGMPEDLNLEPRDCLSLYRAMEEFQTKDFPVSAKLDPSNALPEIITKKDILKWEADLKLVLSAWMSDPASPFDQILAELSKPIADVQNLNAEARAHGSKDTPKMWNDKGILESTLPLLVDLHNKDALPAILFNYDRSQCEKVAQKIMGDLKAAEDDYKENSKQWKKKMEEWEAWKANKEKEAEKAKKASSKAKGKKSKAQGDDPEERRANQQAEAWDSTTSSIDPMAGFDPEAPLEGFHFADWKKVAPSDFEGWDGYDRQLSRRGVAPWLITALKRGVGVHHAGMNRKYRQVVEMLFRGGFLRVVIATGTLALGINMPCKTVVFSGDSVFLTALNFRQSAGRAGRRGFDVLGNVVFQGISYGKICRLLSSRLPDLNGHFPITTSLVLRLMTLLHETKNCKYATKAVNALLSQPRLYLGGEEAKMTVLHHLRFSIEYLRRQSILGSKGEPLNFAGLVSHLYYTENSGFAFHALLKGGYFHALTADIDKSPEKITRELMLVMAHLFGRSPLRRADKGFVQDVVKPSSSIVFLPPLPTMANGLLNAHNEETLAIYRTYVSTFVEQHIHEPDNKLPTTGIPIGAKSDEKSAGQAIRLRSPFVALSGHDDNFTSIHDLCSTVRSGVFLEENVIPHVPAESPNPLNAYLLDFFKHGDVRALTDANKIPPGNVWFVLNDFSLALATIIASFKNFMGMATEGDEAMLDDVRGSGDAAEEAAGEKEDGEVDAEGDGVNGDVPAWDGGGKGGDLVKVLKAFVLLKAEFDEKFSKMWA